MSDTVRDEASGADLWSLISPDVLMAVGALLITTAERIRARGLGKAAEFDPATWKPHLPGKPLSEEQRAFLSVFAQKKGKEGLRWTAAITTALSVEDGKELKVILSALPDPEPWAPAPAAMNQQGHGHTPTRKGR
jgi:hypothetical protein